MIHTLPPTNTYTVEQALASVDPGWLQDVIILGYDEGGGLFVRSSRMDRKDALWMAEMLKRWALGEENPK